MDVADMTVDQLLKELREMVRTVPPAYQRWGSERTQEYKDIAKKATMTLEKGNRNPVDLRRYYKRLRPFYS